MFPCIPLLAFWLGRDPSRVVPVIAPALAPTLDRSLKEDRTLCPVRALHCYLDKTSFSKDIVPATISSWIKQAVLLCYQLSDKDTQRVHQVRAHDVRAFQHPKHQILTDCH